MPLFTGTQQQYYDNSYQVLVDSTINSNSYITLTFSPLPTAESQFDVFLNGSELAQNTYVYQGDSASANFGRLTFNSAPAVGATILVRQTTNSETLGNYQYISIDDIINNFIINYVGEEKIIPRIKRADIAFHAQRAMQELSYDTFKSTKSQEIDIPPSLTMALPHDYVNYVKLSWKDTSGVERIIYPARKTSNPKAILQDADYNYLFNSDNTLLEASESSTWTTYKSQGDANESDADTNQNAVDQVLAEGRRYGLSPENSQGNGLFFIDEAKGYIHFSSDINGKTITLKYISDSLGTDAEMIVHKFAEEAMYKWIAHAVLSTRSLTPEYLIARFKKEKFAAVRQAKLRLSNLKLEEITQVLRNKSKQIKH